MSEMQNQPIGVYDSGMGGLSVWRELYKAFPEESLTYLGDGKNCPYGDRSAEEVRRFADEAVGTLIGHGAKLVVVACNSATAAAIEFLRAKYAQIPIVGMEPAIKPAALSTRSGVIGVLATAASLNGDLFHRTAARYADNIRVITAVGEGFVEIVEQNRIDAPETEQTVRRIVQPMVDAGADRIVLGCTHYPFLREVIERVINDPSVVIIDPAPAVARRTGDLLDRFALRAQAGAEPRYEFLTVAGEEYRKKLETTAFSLAAR